MLWRELVVGGLFAGLLGACAVVDPVDSRYDTVGRSLAKARDEAIFLNIIRASHDYPLAFTTIANVTPTMTNTTGFALPSFSLGPANCLPTSVLSATPVTRTMTCAYGTGFGGAATAIGSSTASNATAVSTNFNVSTEETGSFYQGFLKPIDLQILNYFIRQGYPRELLFWLFADSFQFQRGTSVGPQALGYDYNPPDSYGCPRGTIAGVQKVCFRDWVWAAVLSGLTVEDKTIVKLGGSSSRRDSKDTGTGGAKSPETETVTRFCFSPFLAHQAMNDMGEARSRTIVKYLPISMKLIRPDQYCGNWTNSEAQKKVTEPQEDTFKLDFGPYTFRIVPRSAYGVFQFLGNMLKVQEAHLEPNGAVNTEDAGDASADLPKVTDLPPILITAHNEQLITVLHENGANCFAHTWFYDGDYCVPQEAANTKRIFSLLSQLIAIETQATDLSITPIVRIIE
jgi:hypothetical protein